MWLDDIIDQIGINALIKLNLAGLDLMPAKANKRIITIQRSAKIIYKTRSIDKLIQYIDTL